MTVERRIGGGLRSLRLVHSRPRPNLAPVHNELARKRASDSTTAIASLSDNIDLYASRLERLLAHVIPRRRRPPDDAA